MCANEHSMLVRRRRTVPLEMEIMTREHFNRWYQLGPYYLSVILFEIPFQVSDVWFGFRPAPYAGNMSEYGIQSWPSSGRVRRTTAEQTSI